MARQPRAVEACEDVPVLIDEHIRPDGAVTRTTLEAIGPDRVRLAADDGVTGELSAAALEKVMTRYGRPLDPAVAVTGDAITLGDARLARLRYHAPVDAEARDYLVWQAPGSEPLAALANGVAAALRYLVLRIAEERTSRS
jgi:hypothetical protein